MPNYRVLDSLDDTEFVVTSPTPEAALRAILHSKFDELGWRFSCIEVQTEIVENLVKTGAVMLNSVDQIGV